MTRTTPQPTATEKKLTAILPKLLTRAASREYAVRTSPALLPTRLVRQTDTERDPLDQQQSDAKAARTSHPTSDKNEHAQTN